MKNKDDVNRLYAIAQSANRVLHTEKSKLLEENKALKDCIRELKAEINSLELELANDGSIVDRDVYDYLLGNDFV